MNALGSKIMKPNKMIIACSTILCLGALASCGADKKDVVIFTSLEDYRLADLEACLKRDVPDVKVVVQYLDTGTIVSRVESEGKSTDCDIIVGLEASNGQRLINNNPSLFAELTDYSLDSFLPELLDYPSAKAGKPLLHIFDKEAGSIILNKKVLQEKNLPVPTSFADLLDEKYKGLVMMPNPKTSGTGYYFLNGLSSAWGQSAALEYFDNLAENVKEFSTSGSGPVKALARGEIAVGLGMTFQAALYCQDYPDLEITYFEEGSPFTLYTNAVINGRLEKESVKKVYDYIFNTWTPRDKAEFCPETIYKPEYQPKCNIPGYPENVHYMQMEGLFDPEHKSALLDAWKH